MPIITLLLLAVLAVVFGIEVLLSDPSDRLTPPLDVLLSLGALQYMYVVRLGEWYRLLSAAFLHGDVIHFLVNGVALYLAGSTLEPVVGPYLFLCFYFLGALSGSVVSLLLNSHAIVSVGASGAILALFAAILILSFCVGDAEKRSGMRQDSVRILVTSLLPVAGANTDYAAHFGGLLAGAGLAVALLLKSPAGLRQLALASDDGDRPRNSDPDRG